MKRFQDLSDGVLIESASRVITALSAYELAEKVLCNEESKAYLAALKAIQIACEERTADV